MRAGRSGPLICQGGVTSFSRPGLERAAGRRSDRSRPRRSFVLAPERSSPPSSPARARGGRSAAGRWAERRRVPRRRRARPRGCRVRRPKCLTRARQLFVITMHAERSGGARSDSEAGIAPARRERGCGVSEPRIVPRSLELMSRRKLRAPGWSSAGRDARVDASARADPDNAVERPPRSLYSSDQVEPGRRRSRRSGRRTLGAVREHVPCRSAAALDRRRR